MRTRRPGHVWLVVLLLLTFALTGRSPAHAADPGFSSVIETVSPIDYPKIRVMMRVFTPDATELLHDAFTLHERETPITSFTIDLVRREPFIALLLDRSSSMEPVVTTVKESAAMFVKGMNMPARISLITFASDVDLVTEFTREQEPLLGGIAKMRPWGGTALFDALYQACEQLRSAAGTDDRKTIVLLTDGRDESPQGKPGFSTKKADEVIAHASKNGIRVICVALGTSIDESFLEQLARTTKGALLRAPSAEQLAGIFQKISSRMMLERRYKLSYTTPAPERDGSRRELTVVSEHQGRKDQGTGAYVAPLDPVRVERQPGASDKPGRGIPGIAIREGDAASAATGLGTRTIRHDVRLGRVEAPDTGTSPDIAHVDRNQLATWTDIATEAMPVWQEYKPIQPRPGASEQEKAHIAELNATLKASHDAHQQWRQDFKRDQNARTDQLNREMRELHDQNQQRHDAHIDGVNRNIDELNASKRRMQEDQQQAADENAAGTNQMLEGLEKSLSHEYQVPTSGEGSADAGTDLPGTPDLPDTDSDN
ncbi:MAG TPA: vWA domain-containing protein [Candidatus Ozemobacteraceae bacterium]